MGAKLSREDVLKIPNLLRTKTIGEVGEELGVSSRAVDYWIARLKKEGIKVPTRNGPRPIKLK
jgi:biotin operon repressor